MPRGTRPRGKGVFEVSAGGKSLFSKKQSVRFPKEDEIVTALKNLRQGRAELVGGDAIRLGISSCLLGNEVRYDGGHKLDRYLRDTLGAFVEWVPVCPEVEYGLPIPREALRLVGDPADPRLVTTRTSVDHTAGMKAWAARRLDALEREDLCGFVFKSRSPSSACGRSRSTARGRHPGDHRRRHLRARLHGALPPAARRGRGPPQRPGAARELHRAALRVRALESVPARGRLGRRARGVPHRPQAPRAGPQPEALRALGKFVAGAGARGSRPGGALLGEYLATLLAGLRLVATTSKHTNVLQHAAGYFKRLLSPEEKVELGELIDAYHRGLIPLIVPVTLLAHYTRVYREPWLARQRYLHPHPRELMLRNHV